jgi:dihydrofolate reductase
VTVIVIEFMTVDGTVSDPDGSGATAYGGWAFRHGPQTVAGDKFQLGPLFDTGVMLLGRKTWQLFAGLWPSRTDPFSARMNSIPKVVATQRDINLDAWSNSERIEDVVSFVKGESREVVVAGSLSVVAALQAADLVDEYRLLTFPTAVGTGQPLFPQGAPPTYLECVSAELVGAAALVRYRRSGR